MNKPYLILVNGLLWERKLTKAGALKVIAELQDKGVNAVLGYDITMTQGGTKMFNHDTGKWEPTIWTEYTDGSVTSSIIGWSDRTYITYLQEAVAKSGKQTVDNSWMWKNKIKYTTCWDK